jgi:catechol 2,3-dioxygenase-like lactoylglutathione lyase family enzyme
LEKTAASGADNVAADPLSTPELTMLKQLTPAQVWVHDQDEALAFYTEKLGMELREDVTVPEMGNFRWLSVGVPGQPDVAITLLAVPGPPVFEEDTREQIRALLAQRRRGRPLLLDRRLPGQLRGVQEPRREFVQEPADQPYGIDRVPRPVRQSLPHGRAAPTERLSDAWRGGTRQEGRAAACRSCWASARSFNGPASLSAAAGCRRVRPHGWFVTCSGGKRTCSCSARRIFEEVVGCFVRLTWLPVPC